MKNVGERVNDYFGEIVERRKVSHVYRKYQLIGLEVAKILRDDAHKSLYIKLAKDFGAERLLTLAKSIAELRGVRNKGAYFMKLLYGEHTHNRK